MCILKNSNRLLENGSTKIPALGNGGTEIPAVKNDSTHRGHSKRYNCNI